MIRLSASDIVASFVNVSVRERKSVVLPPDFADLDWGVLDYLGWRDPKSPNLGYAVADLEGVPVGVLLRASSARTRSRPQCSWCEDVTLPNDVTFFSAKRSGPAGRNGDTIGTLVCAEFQCSANVRRRPPVAYIGFDVDAARRRRIEALQQRIRSFAHAVRDGDERPVDDVHVPLPRER